MTEASQGVGSQLGLMVVKNNAQLIQEEAEARRKQIEAEQGQSPILDLVAHLKTKWESAHRAKEPIRRRLIQCENQRDGKYDSDKLALIKKQGGSEIFMMLTNIKCRALEAWVGDIMFQPGERPFNLEPTPVSDLPPGIEQSIAQHVQWEVQQTIDLGGGQMVTQENVRERINEVRDDTRKKIQEEAKKAADRQTQEIEDDFVEGNWYNGLKDFLYDIATFPTAFFEGPIIRRKQRLTSWEPQQDGTWEPIVSDELVREYDRLSPYDYFPAPGAISVKRNWGFIRRRLTRSQLTEFIGVPGYNDDAIRMVLDRYSPTNFTDSQKENQIQAADPRRDLKTGSEFHEVDPDGEIIAKNYKGPIQGKLLIEWGMTQEDGVDDPEEEYEVDGWLIDNWVIKAVMNEHPLKEKGIYAASFDEKPDTVWGNALPEIMRDNQSMCNAAARAIVNNMGMASGPMVEWNISRLAPGQDITQIHPWKIFQTTDDKSGANSQAVRFYQPDSQVERLKALYDYFYKQASEVTGIPAYIYGQESIGGAGRTATGLSMLMNAASKGLKKVVHHIDRGIVEPSVVTHHHHILLFSPENAYAGDLKVRARASEYLMMLEQLQVRLIEVINATSNPIDAEIMGKKGRGWLLRKAFNLMKLPGDEIVQDDEALEALEEQQQMMGLIQTISDKFKIPIETIMLSLQVGGKQPSPEAKEKPKETTPAGQGMGGSDVTQFGGAR